MPKVAEILARTLVEYGTEKFFCLMGGDHDLWIALHDAGIEIVNCRSEAAAVYMADGYARVTGRPGFVYGQRGPGVANVAGAMADPLWAQSPVVSLTSSIAMTSRDRFEYQELDGLPLHDAVTIWNKTVSTPKRAAAMLRAAIRVATGPAPGPVHLEIPADMFAADAGDEAPYCERGMGRVNARRIPAPDGAMAELVDRLIKAERPLIMAGKGVVISEAWAELQALAEALSVPVITSLGGKGAIDEQSDLALGCIGRSSRRIANDALRESDFVVVIGSRLGGLATHAWQLPFGAKPLAQIDSNPHMIGHNFRVEIGILADARLALEAALRSVRERGLARGRTAWATHCTAKLVAWRANADRLAEERPDDGIHPAEILAQLRGVMAPEDVIVADTGAHGAWTGALFPVAQGRTMARANGSLGWAYPGALGVALGLPDRRTVAFGGDGGMMYHIGEIETALRIGIPVVSVVVNNASLASEYRGQRDRWGRVIPEVLDFLDVDFAAIARGFGAVGIRVADRAELPDALREAMAANRPAVVDVVSSREAAAPTAFHDADRLV